MTFSKLQQDDIEEEKLAVYGADEWGAHWQLLQTPSKIHITATMIISWVRSNAVLD